MKLLITSLPGYGHLCPLVTLAQAIQAKGHEVAFATSKKVSGILIPETLPVFGSGPEWFEADFAHDTAIHAHPAITLPLHKYLADVVVPQMMVDVAVVIEQWCPDVILSNEYERTGCVLAEKYNIPFVLVSAGPRVSREWRRQSHAALYAVSRNMADLPADPELNYMFRRLHLYLTPREYIYDDRYCEADNEFGVRLEVTDSSTSIKHFDTSIIDPTRKKVFCTFGTVFNKNAELIDVVVKAFENSPYQLIVTHSPGMNTQLANKDKNCIFLPEYIPLTQLAPHMDLFITHGGTSTLLTLLQYGKPFYLLPQGADQHTNAIACHKFGLAEVDFASTPQAIGVEQGRVLLSPYTVYGAVERLLLSSNVGDCCEAMKKCFANLPNLSFAVDLIEQCAVSTRS